MIKVENLSKRFKDTLAVDNVSFSIKRGEVVGFLGPNGAGKTTTMRLLTNYLSPDFGTISIAGFDPEVHTLAARKTIGYLPESAPLYNDLSVLETLRYFASIRRIPKSERGQKIKEMVEVCGLSEVIKRQVGVLSKGYRQRVGLAQTLMHDPDILILDEPTTGLDPNQRVDIRNLIRTISKEKTIIVSTHILSEVQATCSRLLIINRGKIVADGAPEELSRKLKGENIFRIGVKGEAQEMLKALEEADFVISQEILEKEDHSTLISVRGSSTMEDLGAALFDLAHKKGIVLNEIHHEGVSLENVFASLTLGEKDQ